jgi:hypothetical protein
MQNYVNANWQCKGLNRSTTFGNTYPKEMNFMIDEIFDYKNNWL